MSRELKPEDFCMTHCHTVGSLLDGLQTVEDVVKKSKDEGYHFCGITDHGRMIMHADFEAECRKQGIKPILGVEAYIVDDASRVKEEKDKRRYHITLFAKSRKGYENLCKMMYIANKENYYYKPLIDLKLLKENSKDIIILDGCSSSMVSQAILENNFDKAKELMKFYKSLVGDDYYSELQIHGLPNFHKKWDKQEIINKKKTEFARELNVKRILSADCHYSNKEDVDIHEVLLCVGTGRHLSDPTESGDEETRGSSVKRMSLKDFDLSVPSFKEVLESANGEYDDAILNTKLMAESVKNFDISDGETHLPNYIVDSGRTQGDEIRFLSYKGIVKRYHNKEVSSIEEAKEILDEKVISRMEYELSVINKLGFDGYLLIVQEFINWGKERGIYFGAGRGSSSGSLVCYALGITEIDSLSRSEFMFERFMNEERVSLPDIDTDIEDTRRDELVNHMIERYGEDHVSGILALGSMRPKNSFRDVARVLEFPFEDSLRISKMIPDAVYGGGKEFPQLLSPDNQETAEFRQAVAESEKVQEIVKIASKLEGTIRNISQHACGLLVTPEPIYKFMPVEKAGDNLVSGFTMHHVEGTCGLFKFDFLGLSNLGIISDAISQIKDKDENQS